MDFDQSMRDRLLSFTDFSLSVSAQRRAGDCRCGLQRLLQLVFKSAHSKLDAKTDVKRVLRCRTSNLYSAKKFSYDSAAALESGVEKIINLEKDSGVISGNKNIVGGCALTQQPFPRNNEILFALREKSFFHVGIESGTGKESERAIVGTSCTYAAADSAENVFKQSGGVAVARPLPFIWKCSYDSVQRCFEDDDPIKLR
ncbi:hypothetical protein EVAR_48600_1 [Eumeta japonica]|uniref:Uncharacterized protein n=1 Tax=Eumeta variegata TaxID=151549 RepID=A0A4C1YZL3_EUMVA|nr:hypothetical protein EVAR_48600_1 [Eumeta japonica]